MIFIVAVEWYKNVTFLRSLYYILTNPIKDEGSFDLRQILSRIYTYICVFEVQDKHLQTLLYYI